MGTLGQQERLERDVQGIKADGPRPTAVSEFPDKRDPLTSLTLRDRRNEQGGSAPVCSWQFADGILAIDFRAGETENHMSL